jgi:SNF2 family DNA or RNA helicase
MAEDQAMDRVHRIGQAQEVRIIRYLVKGTIEMVSVVSIDPLRHLADTLVSMSPTYNSRSDSFCEVIRST